jgi:signal peptide peptidase SppA
LVSASFDIDRFLAGKPLAISMAGLEELKAHVLARLALFEAEPSATVQQFLAAAAERSAQAARPTKATGVIPIRGTISQRATGDMSGATVGGSATEDVAGALRAMLADDSINKIVLDIDSPGGSSYGVAELFDEIYGARGQKPIVAIANSLAASAAYWIGSAADRFLVTPGGLVGSIGVYSVHQDISGMAEKAGVKTTFISAGKHKVEGNEFEPLGDETRARIQERVNEVYDQFIYDVARGRGASLDAVRNGYGEGDVLTAKKAKAEGLVDGVMTFDEVLSHNFRSRATGVDARADAGEQWFWAIDDQPANTDEGRHRLDRMRLRSFQATAASSAV